MQHKKAWAEILTAEGLKEIGGSHNNEGVDYARYWTITRLLELEEINQADYAFLFEYLQDVAELDSSTDSKCAALYQLKKKEAGSWSKASLCRKEKPKEDKKAEDGPSPDGNETLSKNKGANSKKLSGSSHIGKLHVCTERLNELADTEGVFVSNAPLSDMLDAKGTPVQAHIRIAYANLHAGDQDYFHKNLAKELNRTKEELLLHRLHFERKRPNATVLS